MRWLVLMVLMVLLAGDAVASGAIRGTLWPGRSEARRAERLRFEAAKEHRGGLFGILRSRREAPSAAPVRNPNGTQSVILVRSIPAAFEQKLARAAAPEPRRIVITGGGFVPVVTVLTSGESITIENRDTLWHDVFSVVPGSRFDSGKLGPGAVKTVKLRVAGTIPLHCDFHASEVGFVRVTTNHAFACPDSLGRFRVPDLPPGEYDIELWHPWRGSRVAHVTVPRHGDALCDLAF
jgi:hypothetical protein